MEVVLALLLGLVVGGGIAFFAGMYYATNLFGRAVVREMEAGRLTEEVADKLTDLREHSEARRRRRR